MNVIDGQAGLVNYSSLIFYSLTINNILNIVVLLILASVTISAIFSDNGIIKKAQEAANKTKEAVEQEQAELKCTPNVRQKSLIIWVHFFVEKGQTKYVEK